MNRVSALRASVSTGALFRAALLTAGILLAATPADAALYYYRDSDPGMSGSIERPQPPRKVQRARRAPKKQETKVKETTVHPQMPLVISVSIGSQRVKIYDANGLFAEAPVSTGMPGHPTPQGVFSVIEKDRYHHSNIYSGAPMPFMQRITWGGVAMHAGVLPGYPASHGCIRMPNDFATKMWGWTKMGARVFVTPGEVPAPAAFAHPFLAAYKVAPQPVVAEPPEDPAAKVGPKADLARDRDRTARSAAVGRTRQACRRSDNAHRRRRSQDCCHDDGCGPSRAARAEQADRNRRRGRYRSGKVRRDHRRSEAGCRRSCEAR